MPRIEYEDEDGQDISKLLIGDIVYWKDPSNMNSGHYEVMWMSVPVAKQNESTKVRIWNAHQGEFEVSLGSIAQGSKR
jgi:hypothetical protein